MVKPPTSKKNTEAAPELIFSLPSLTTIGSYTFSWRVVSADGHPVGGTLRFSLQTTSDVANADALAAAGPPALALWLSKAAVLISLFAAIGLFAWRSLNGALDQARRLGLVLSMVAAAASLANLGLVGLDATGLPLAALLQSEVWSAAAQTSVGVATLLALLSICTAMLGWFLTDLVAKRVLAAFALLLFVASFAVTGHASSAPPQWLARPAISLHSLAAVFWIGAFLPLWLVLTPRNSTPLAVLNVFNYGIPVALLLLIISGVVLAFLQLVGWASLWETAYGQVLLIKLLFVAVLLAVGFYNRRHLTAAVQAGDVGAKQRLRRIIAFESFAVMAVFLAVAYWRLSPPPRALLASTVPVIVAQDVNSQVQAEIKLKAAASSDQATVYLTKNNKAFAAQEVSVVFTSPEAQIEAIKFATSQTDKPGLWQLEGFKLPEASSWEVQVKVLVSDFERLILKTAF